ncbi:MAG: hypothetical protein ACRD4L_03155 [Pyrinomonadaceae bacterium]
MQTAFNARRAPHDSHLTDHETSDVFFVDRPDLRYFVLIYLLIPLMAGTGLLTYLLPIAYYPLTQGYA